MTNQAKPFIVPERNPLTHARHRKEVFWQVTFPVLIGVVILFVMIAAVLVMTVNEAQVAEQLPIPENTALIADIGADEFEMLYYFRSTTNRLATVSEIWLLLLMIVFTLVTMLILIAIVFLFTKMLGVLPGYMRIGQDFMTLTALRVARAMDFIVEPWLKSKSTAAAARQARIVAIQQASDVLGKISGNNVE